MKEEMTLPEPIQDKKARTDLLELIFQERLKYSALVSSAIDHSLHTPLVIIKGLAEMCLRNPDQDLKSKLRKISKEAEHILEVLSAMPFVTTTASAQMQNISLKCLIDQVVIFFEKRCLQEGISLKNDVSEKIRVEVEPNRLKNILLSIIQNAVDSFDHIPANAARSIYIHTQNHDGRVDLVVSDTGGGISTHLQENVVNKILSDQGNIMPLNTYLGLSLAKKMSDDLGTKIAYVTVQEKGTSFTISFPKK